MNAQHTLFGSLLLAGALAACGGGGAAPSSAAPASAPASAAAKPSAAASVAAKPATGAASSSAKPAASAASAKPAASGSAATKPAASGSAAKPAPSIAPATTVATLKVTANPTLGSILTDGNGRTLYTFAPASDPASKDATKCPAACLGPWPPFLTTDVPTAPTGVTGKLGVVMRTDFNVKQVTYNDMPLYYFVQDTAAGDAKGQNSKGFNGDWQVVKTS